MGDVVAHQLGRELRPLDLFDVDGGFLAGELGQLVPKLVDFGAPLADDNPWPAGVHRNRHLARPTLDVHLGDSRVSQPLLEVLPDQLVFLEQRRHLLGGKPARGGLPDDAQPEPNRMRLLTHYSFSLLST